MNATACHYSIIRFLPFVETGEFANVGIVLFAPAARRFCYRILSRRVARITTFFEDLDASVVRASIRGFEDELARISHIFKAAGTDRRLRSFDVDACMTLWGDLIRPRETVIRMSESRVVMAMDPLQKVRELFDFYIERNFVTKEYQEQVLDRALRRLLYQSNLGARFAPHVVGNDEYHARFPFVEVGEEGRAMKAIKPLHLTHDDPAKIIDHGGQWVVRVRALKNRGLLPGAVLFAVDGTDADHETPRGRARQEVVGELSALDVQVAPMGDKLAILSFASGQKASDAA